MVQEFLSLTQGLAEQYLEKVELGDLMHHLPSELSGGKRLRRRCSAPVNRPSIILADEPTGSPGYKNR